jgi:hypothetical protein
MTRERAVVHVRTMFLSIAHVLRVDGDVAQERVVFVTAEAVMFGISDGVQATSRS